MRLLHLLGNYALCCTIAIASTAFFFLIPNVTLWPSVVLPRDPFVDATRNYSLGYLLRETPVLFFSTGFRELHLFHIYIFAYVIWYYSAVFFISTVKEVFRYFCVAKLPLFNFAFFFTQLWILYFNMKFWISLRESQQRPCNWYVLSVYVTHIQYTSQG